MKLRNKVSIPREFSYFDKFQDRLIELTPDKDELVVTLQPNLEETESFKPAQFDSLTAFEGMLSTNKFNSKLGIAVFNFTPDEDLLEVSERLETPDLANSLPAWLDSDGNKRYLIPDEVTVQFNDELPVEVMEEIITGLGSEIIVEQRTPGYYTVSVPPERTLFGMINEFNQREEVVFSEPSEISFDDDLVAPPNDQYFNKLWGLRNNGQIVNGARGKKGIDIDILDAWDITKGDKSIVLAIIDSGMDMTHPDLEPNLLPRNGEDWDFADSDGSPDDEGSHGTHVCGTAGAMANNRTGIAGVAPNCSLMPLRINLTAGKNQNRADAINYVAAQAKYHKNRRYIINCSWRASKDFTAITYAIKRTVKSNVIILFAAGNKGDNMDRKPQYPGVLPEVMCVASIDSRNRKARKSNYGTQVDICAPGVNVYSTVPKNDYDYKSGTSMATPHVAGVTALVWSVNKRLTSDEVRKIVENNVKDVYRDNRRYRGKLGKGRVNAHLAVLKAVEARSNRVFSELAALEPVSE